MICRRLLAIALIITTLFFLAATAVATDDDRFRHSVRYDTSGQITLRRTLGYGADAGAIKEQSVIGYGDFKKWENVRMAKNIITTDEETWWSVPDDAPRDFVVTTTLDWQSRAMSTAEANYYFPDQGYLIRTGDIINPYILPVVEGFLPIRRMTDQEWVTRLTTNPGNSGSYDMEFFAAYGPGPYEEGGVLRDSGLLYFYDDEYMWRFDPDKEDGIARGKKYVGNYFHIKQYANTTNGRLLRRISMSDPFTGGFLVEEVDATGLNASVRETFEIDILEAGRDAITLKWHDVF